MVTKKKLKVYFIATAVIIMVGLWLVLFLTKTKDQQINYYWGTALAILSISFSLLSFATAKKWSWFKSSLGKAIIFISSGIMLWGIGQSGWMYYVLRYPDKEIVQSKPLDVIFLLAIPLWTFGIIMLSRATGVKYALKKPSSKIIALLATMALALFSYYLLIVIARGGFDVVKEKDLWTACVDFLLTIGSAINLILATVIFGFSWKLLGGRFKNPIKITLVSFGLMYFADFVYAYLSAKELYYNADISDLLYFVAISTMSLALCLLDPSTTKQIMGEQEIAQKQQDALKDVSGQQPVLEPNQTMHQEGQDR